MLGIVLNFEVHSRRETCFYNSFYQLVQRKGKNEILFFEKGDRFVTTNCRVKTTRELNPVHNLTHKVYEEIGMVSG